MGSNHELIFFKGNMAGPSSVTSSGAFRAQQVLEPLYNIVYHHIRTDSPAQPNLRRFSSRFMVLAYFIKSGPRREAPLTDDLLGLLEGCFKAKVWSDSVSLLSRFSAIAQPYEIRG